MQGSLAWQAGPADYGRQLRSRAAKLVMHDPPVLRLLHPASDSQRRADNIHDEVCAAVVAGKKNIVCFQFSFGGPLKAPF